MKLMEALNIYKNDKNRTALYEALSKTGLKVKETKEVLRDTLKENYSRKDYEMWMSSRLLESAKKAETYESGYTMDSEEWDEAEGLSVEDVFAMKF
jgi:hypothetical protein